MSGTYTSDTSIERSEAWRVLVTWLFWVGYVQLTDPVHNYESGSTEVRLQSYILHVADPDAWRALPASGLRAYHRYKTEYQRHRDAVLDYAPPFHDRAPRPASG
ncbi:hypothetical protein B0T18DRAFT_433482 [Schizothecium vesticola]|uniref:Uncharacterized protein n=1 Tax=Schizothecium vesticola TaxID=314040 RepID=A0AA40EIL2_9PEZI|nr:hypothetical protein B0T18DRAFT_433482 [Schizothecium vesticola]